MKLHQTRHVHLLAHYEALHGEVTDGSSGFYVGLIGGVRIVGQQAHHEHILVGFDLKSRCGQTCSLSGENEGIENGTKFLLLEGIRGDEGFTGFTMVSSKNVPKNIRKR